MSRPIKFRAWDKKRKHYAKVIQTTNQGWKGYRDKTYVANGVMLFSKWVLSRFIIEQYTGLKDKNGKEIYEGDIVEGDMGVFEVEWYDLVARFMFTPNTDMKWHPPFVYDQVNEMKVIGNIHESNMEELCPKETNNGAD